MNDPGEESSRHLACPDCPRKFSRPSHLDRHRITHLEPLQKSLIPCPQCNRTFSRRDVLLRHLRGTHNVERREKRTAQKSCFHCAAKKLKCERSRPCSGCIRSEAVCEYPSVDEPVDVPLDNNVVDRGPENADVSVSNPPATLGTGGPDGNSLPYLCNPAPFTPTEPVEASFPLALNTPESTARQSFASSISQGDPSQARQRVVTDFASDLSSASPAFRPQQPFDALLPGVGQFLAPDDTDFSPTQLSLAQPDYCSTGLDWLSLDMTDLAPCPQLYVTTQLDISWPWLSRAPAQETETDALSPSQPRRAPNEVLSQARTARNSPVLRPIEPQQAAQPWPFDQTRDSTPHVYLLPPLRDVLKSICQANPPGQSALLSGLITVLSESRLPHLSRMQSSHSSQAFSELQRLLDLYFVRFHDIQPIVHKPTWKMSSCPTVLLTAMACVGALLSDNPQDTELSLGLSEICMTMVNWMGASDGTNYRDVSYLNALCLHQIYSLGSGNRQLYQNADRSRGTLIGSLRGMGLLSAHWGIGEEDAHENVAAGSEDADSLSQEWKAWIERESERRAAWAAFEYDCSLCTLTSRRGAVDLSELPRKLPCAESIWGATSARAWLALRSRLGASSFSPILWPTLKGTLAGKAVPPSLGTWARRLCTQVLGRLLWDIKQLEAVAMPGHFGLPSLLGAHQQSKQTLLKALNGLHDSMTTPESTPELISYNISGLLYHYSHIYAADDVMDIIIYIVRNLISSTSSKDRGPSVARERLKSTFAKDPQSARRLVWHAAQIVSIANEYLVSAPCEIMRVFMGYIFILAYSAYGPRDPPSQKESVRLEIPDHRQGRAILQWIQTGGAAAFGSVGNICADGCIPAISRDAQAMMQKLRCWGLAEKFCKILHIFEVSGF